MSPAPQREENRYYGMATDAEDGITDEDLKALSKGDVSAAVPKFPRKESPSWAAPSVADMAVSWRSGSAWMAGDSLYVLVGVGAFWIPLADIDSILITDASYRRTPTWAVVLGILGIFFFLLGLLFFLVKTPVPLTRITIYIKGNPPTPVVLMDSRNLGLVQTEWYPVLRQIGSA
jgi:hypothetical protein